MSLHFTCPKGHKISAPYALDICPLAFCQEKLTPCGPGWGPLKNKAQTQEHYGNEAQKADA